MYTKNDMIGRKTNAHKQHTSMRRAPPGPASKSVCLLPPTKIRSKRIPSKRKTFCLAAGSLYNLEIYMLRAASRAVVLHTYLTLCHILGGSLAAKMKQNRSGARAAYTREAYVQQIKIYYYALRIYINSKGPVLFRSRALRGKTKLPLRQWCCQSQIVTRRDGAAAK